MMRRTGSGQIAFILLMTLGQVLVMGQEEASRRRAREIGIKVGVLSPGRWNAITDVPGVRVGQVTMVEGESTRTGVTAIVPHSDNVFLNKVPAAVYVANGFGKLIGTTQVEELGNIETPILLTATLNVPRVADALIDYMLQQPGMERVRSINPIVGETNDGYLNDIQKRPVGREQVFAALEQAASGPVEEGSVGAGTGTSAFGFKGGIGTSSRKLPASVGGFTVGVLVQTNYGGVLRMGGAPVGVELGRYYLKGAVEQGQDEGAGDADGSCMIVVATDAPMSSRNLQRMARRAMLGLGNTGGTSTNGSGDYIIAFSTAKELRVPYNEANTPEDRKHRGARLSNSDASPLFQAAIEATEEAIYNSMLMATSVTGHQGRRREAIPMDQLIPILREYSVIGN